MTKRWILWMVADVSALALTLPACSTSLTSMTTSAKANQNRCACWIPHLRSPLTSIRCAKNLLAIRNLDVLKENATTTSKVKLPGWSRDPHMSDSYQITRGSLFHWSWQGHYHPGLSRFADFFGKQICCKTSLQWLAISHCAQRKDKFWNGRKLKGIHSEAEAHCHRLWNEDVLRMQKEEEFCFSKPKLSVKRGLS